MTKRRHISLLPSIHQTEALSHFFNSTVDQLFQDGKTVPVSGYIGRKPAHYDATKDFYKPEPTAARERYQLEPLMVSETDGSVTSKLFYEDLLSLLAQEGAATQDPNRLFGAGYYSWAPPIDIDRIMNFQQYYWSGSSTSALELVVPGVEIGAKYYGTGHQRTFALPPTLASREVEEEDVTVLINGVRATGWTRDGDEITFTTSPTKDALIVIFRYGNVGDGVRNNFRIPAHCGASEGLETVYVFLNGRETTDFTVDEDEVVLDVAPASNVHVMVTRIKELKERIEGGVSFDPIGLTKRANRALVNGMRVRLVDPINFTYGYDLKAYGHPWDEAYANTFFVEGVDIRIELVETDDITLIGDGFAADDPRYVVVAREDAARSYWSKINRWVHKDAFIEPSEATAENRAKRPILEFITGLQQINYGTHRVRNVSGMISQDPSYEGTPVPFDTINGLPEGSMTVDDGFRPRRGDYLIVNLPDEVRSTIFFVDITESDDGPLMVLEPYLDVEEGAVTSIKNKDYYFEGGSWHLAPTPGQYPLFDLFDSEGNSLSDEGIYPDTDFVGSKIFGFDLGEGAADPLVKLPLTYDTYGQIQFENELATQTFSYRDGEIGGYYYYNRNGVFENGWHHADAELVQQIDENNVSEIPLGLQANPDFEVPTILSRNDWFAHFSSILENQVGFEGKPYSANNWNKTDKDVTKGLVIIQHEAPLLKLMALMATPELSIRKALSFAEREYTRQKARLLKHVKELSEEQDVSRISSEELMKMAMKRANSIKTNTFPFATTNVGGDQYYLPFTPALLGITRIVKPHIETDGFDGSTYVVGHDGSRMKTFGDSRDGAVLALETAIYENALETTQHLSLAKIVSGKYRERAYTRHDLNAALLPQFEAFIREHRLSMENTTFDENDPFTWNYSQMVDRDGEELPGHWRGIYRHYFDTDRPNTHPWEMLGFSDEPSWWAAQYGPAPYTRDNVDLWSDIEAGVIREGVRAGTHAELARPNLMQVLPVDKQGRIIDPFAATIILQQNPIQFARERWAFGDGSPVEAAWRKSSAYVFALALAKFRLKPAVFVERFWDIENEAVIHGSQTVQLPELRRIRHADIYVSGEELADGSTKKTTGIQNWVTDYLTYRGLSTSVLGETIRGLSVRLGHKVAGFTTKDRMTVSSESFGLVPDEDIAISLYSSPNHAEFFYSGILIERVARGFRVIGYNGEKPTFDIIRGDPNSKKIRITIDGSTERSISDWRPSVYYKKDMHVSYQDSVFRCVAAHTSSSKFEEEYWVLDPQGSAIANTTVIRHQREGEEDSIAYGTVLPKLQDVADLIFGYERKLRSVGFEFSDDEFSESSFTSAVRNFVRWAAQMPEQGTFITLSPAARELTFRAENGMTIELEDALTDRTGHAFAHDNFTVDRFDDYTVIKTDEEDIYGARLFLTEVEHCLIFSNETIFSDVIFNPLYNIRQDRLKVSARRAGNWQGRYEAEGFVIDGDSIKPNFAKLGEDIREMFDIELADNTVLRDHARHLIGFESREYLDKLLLNETQQFELYQGMIQQKGSAGALSTILRSERIGENREVEFLEEWAFRSGSYGAYKPELGLEFSMVEPFRSSQRQLVHLTDATDASWVDVSENWVSPQESFRDLLSAKTTETFATAGFARTNEVTHIVSDYDALTTMAKTTLLQEGETIWLTHLARWDVVRLCNPTDDRTALLPVRIESEDTTLDPTLEDYRIIFSSEHNLQVGESFILSGGNDKENAGVHEVLRVGPDWVEAKTLQQVVYNDEAEVFLLQPPVVLRPETTRFALTDSLSSYEFSGPVYMGEEGNWVVKKKIATQWVEQRRSGLRIENKKVRNATVYRDGSEIVGNTLNVQPESIFDISVIDPLSGLVAGMADRELSFKLEYNPADYDEWGPEQLGMLWWDTSTARFIDVYTDAAEELAEDSARYEVELNYRKTNWGRLVPSSSVDIYEWTRTTVQPDLDEEYVARVEFNATLGKNQTVYYLWRLNPTSIPRTGERRLSARACGEIILNPAKGGIIWNAVIAPNAFILSGADELLDEKPSNYRIDIEATTYQGDIHTQWELHRPSDKALAPPARLWNKLMDSLRGFDKDFRPIPSPELHDASSAGIEEGQSMFGNADLGGARKSFVDMLNYILARSDLSRYALHLLDVSEPLLEDLSWTAQTGVADWLPNYDYDAVAHTFEEVESLLSSNDRVLLDRRHTDAPSYSVWEKDGNDYRIAKAFDVDYADTEEMEDGFSLLAVGDRFCVRSDDDANGFWTVWKKTASGSMPSATNRVLLAAQRYDTADFWYRADWYAEGYGPEVSPNVTYANIGERTNREGAVPTNDFVKIDDGVSDWYWTKFEDGEWEIVARQNGTVQLSTAFYTAAARYATDSTFDLSLISKRDGSNELALLADAAIDNLLTVADKNELWYSMLHHIHATVDLVDWAFKTSFLNVSNFNERMWQSPVATTDNTDLLLEYIDEVKPYRTKVRDIIRTSAPDIENVNAVVTDFDKPVYFDTQQGRYRVLDPISDADILASGVYRHFTEFEEFRRKTTISMMVDRMWGENVEGAGAAERIMAFYQPGSNMRAKSLDDLMNLDFKGTIYDGRSLTEIEADVTLKGSDDAASQLDVVGTAMRDPAAQGLPEELVKVGISDGLVMTVLDRWGSGAPQHVVRQFDVSRRTVDTVTLDIGIVADSIAVFRDGIRAPASAYEFDAVSNSVTVDVNDGARTQLVTIHSFGFSAIDRIMDQKLYQGGGVDFEMTDAYTGLVEVLVNGEVIDGVTTNLNTVTLPDATTSSDAVLITLYSTHDPKPVRQQTEELAYNAQKEWTLTKLSESTPHHVEMIVEKNGLRLTPPRTFYSDNELSVYVGAVSRTSIKVYDDEGVVSTPADAATLTNAQMDDIQDVIAFARSKSKRFVFWHNRVVFADDDANGRLYTVVLSDGDFTINDAGLLKVTAPMSVGDTILVTSFTNSSKVEARTYSFHGAGTGIYPIRSKKHGRAWLSVDGKRLVENVDYEIIGRSGGAWDIDPFEAYSYDSYQDVQFALRLPGLDDSSRVVITTFEGKENNSAHTWQFASKAPSEAWLVEEEDGVLYVPRDAWDIIGLDDMRRSGELLDAVENEGDTLRIGLNPLDAPSSVIPSQPLMVPTTKTPGVIWIAGERIEYFGYSRNGDEVTLTELRRGTRGTSMIAHDAGEIVLDGGSLLDRLPPCPDDDFTNECCHGPDDGTPITIDVTGSINAVMNFSMAATGG